MRKVILLSCTLAIATLHAQNHLTITATERYFNVVRRNLEASADAMPADKYSFKLTDGQMSFAQWLNHSTPGIPRASMTVTVRGGIVTGTVLSPQLQPAAGVDITIDSGGLVSTTTTDGSGAFTLAGVGGGFTTSFRYQATGLFRWNDREYYSRQDFLSFNQYITLNAS